jgi:LacI family transcriptional regulator
MAVSVRDVAAVAAVSVGTVSNVLNRPDKVAPATAERVLAAIASLGFVRNDAARQLRAGRSRSIGLVVLDIRNPFFTDIARGAEERAAEKGMTLLVGSSQEDPDREGAYLDLFLEQRVSGVLLSPVADTRDRLERLRSNGVPVVLVDRQSKDHTFSSVAVDDVVGGRLAVRHLVDVGRRRIAYVGGPPSIRQVADRLRGARQAVRRAPGVELEVVQTDALTVLAGRAAGELIRERRPGDRPDAIFAANDLLAIGILQALMLPGGLRVPEDIALIGYDDIDFASASVVPLSSIRQPAGVIGRRAVELLLDESFAEDDGSFETDRVLFQPELIVRESTRSGPPR